ncbi:energy transducer TonB [Stenotrophomonas lactitubi]|uniref:energy transducer TonB n=2 Tax=Stenotrophomonas lactitubi TaxID=2045214 RepID=UPI001E3D4F9F|nr:energy transducer TonB [Stenotrophomonas lactitubi]
MLADRRRWVALGAMMAGWAMAPAATAQQDVRADEESADTRMSADERRVFLLQEQFLEIARANASRSETAEKVETYASVDADSQRQHPVQLENHQPSERGVGAATLLVDVDEQGRPYAVEIARGSGSAKLDAAAVEAAYRWSYNAASRDGVPVRGKVRITVSGP